MKRSILLLGVLLGIFSCATPPEETESVNSAVRGSSAASLPAGSAVHEEIPAEERVFEEVGIGFTGPAEGEYRTFSNKDELLTFIPEKDLFREIDFSREMVLACFMGEQPTGGYMNQITGLEESSEVLTVYVEITEPKEGDLVAQMVTYPWHAVVTALSEKRLEWMEIKADR